MSYRFSLPRETAIPSAEGRRCANCGDLIDPIDWCQGCKTANGPCGQAHSRARKRADAAFCDDECRSAHRSSFARDCLPLR